MNLSAAALRAAPCLSWISAAWLSLAPLPALAGALDDLSIAATGRLCRTAGQTGATEMAATNRNPSRAILATLAVDSDVRSYDYVDAVGRPAVFTYPFTQTHWLAPGGSAVLGCASVSLPTGEARQTFTASDAAYAERPTAFPENPADFVGAIVQPRPSRCVASNPGLWLINRHPSRTIVARVEMGGGEIGPVYLPPQSTGPWLGCQHDRAPGPVKIVNIQFSSPAR